MSQPQPLRLVFPGGEVTACAPTREALLLSAKQWANAARERAHDAIAAGTDSGADMTYIIGCLAHVERILAEAGAK